MIIIRLFLALELVPHHDNIDINHIYRYHAEPLKAIIIPTTLFKTNKKGIITGFSWPKYVDILMILMSKFKLNIIITGSRDASPFLQYISESVWQKYLQSRSPLTMEQRFSKPHRDHLKIPLQPLADNLESETYKVMEADPIKYNKYQEALSKALVDLVKAGKKRVAVLVIGTTTTTTSTTTTATIAITPTSITTSTSTSTRTTTSSSSTTTTTVINTNITIIPGPGRGFLIDATIKASKQAKLKEVMIYAVEKNSNAINTLKIMKNTNSNWGNVNLYHCDVRYWKPLEQCDVMVSELLGSWGDNESSPECLNIAQQYLKKGYYYYFYHNSNY